MRLLCHRRRLGARLGALLGARRSELLRHVLVRAGLSEETLGLAQGLLVGDRRRERLLLPLGDRSKRPHAAGLRPPCAALLASSA